MSGDLECVTGSNEEGELGLLSLAERRLRDEMVAAFAWGCEGG